LKSNGGSATVLTKMHFTLHGLLVLLLMLLVTGVVLWAGLAAIVAWAILHPPRMSAGKAIYHLRRLSPGDLGLGFEDQPFTVRNARSGGKLHISAWWIPASVMSEKCVVLIHGYADAKVGAIAWAPALHDLGLNILAIDLRAHGESGGSCCTGGFFERDDVDQVIDQLLILYPQQTRQMILFGASLGAAVACGVAANRVDISAIILESPITDYRRAIAAQIRLIGLPTGSLLRAAIRCAEWFSGARFSEVRTLDLMAKLTCPVLTIVGNEDELLNAEDFKWLVGAAAANPSGEIWRVEDCGHLQAMAADPMEYERRMRAFLSGSLE
jgi:pimeloyl-ACP methyl ester carboxylesterase